jgi:hypothetical protein
VDWIEGADLTRSRFGRSIHDGFRPTQLILGARETEAFVDAILRPAEPGPVFRDAANRYKKSLGH